MKRKFLNRTYSVKNVMRFFLIIFCCISLLGQSGVVTSFASGTQIDTSVVTQGTDNLFLILAALVSSLGQLILLWAVLEFGMSLQSNDGSMTAFGFKRFGGGFLMGIAPQIIALL